MNLGEKSWKLPAIGKTLKVKDPVVVFLILTSLLILVFGKSFKLRLAAADAPAPEIIILSPENTTYTMTSVQLIFTIDTEISWIGYSLDFQENVTIAGNTTLTELSEGRHNVIVFANGTSGLMGTSETVYFTVSPLHDVAVIHISLPFNEICSGETIGLNVTVRNEGSVRESFNVTVYYNNTIIETKLVSNLTQGSNVTLTFNWNTSTTPAGIYIIRGEAQVVVGEVDVDDNVLVYGPVKLYPKPLLQISPSNIQAEVEQTFQIGLWIVNITNLYHFEFNFHYNSSLLYIAEVIACDEYGMFLIGPYARQMVKNDAVNGILHVCLTQSNVTIPVSGSGQLANIKIKIVKTIPYSWKPNSTNFVKCNLRLGDSRIGVKFEDVRFLEQDKSEITVYGAEYLFTPVPGDLNSDGSTDVIDLSGCGKKLGETGENPFDLNGDEIVDELDLFLIAVHWNIGRTKP